MFFVIEVVRWRRETGCLAAEMSGRVVAQVRGRRGVEADGACVLHDL